MGEEQKSSATEQLRKGEEGGCLWECSQAGQKKNCMAEGTIFSLLRLLWEDERPSAI